MTDFNMGMCEAPRLPGEDYLLRLTAEQVDWLVGIFMGIRKNEPRLLQAPMLAHLELKVLLVRGVKDLATESGVPPEKIGAAIAEVHRELVKMKEQAQAK